MLYFFALLVENPNSYKKFFKSAAAIIKCPYQDKLDLFVNKDVEDTTSLLNIWEINSWKKWLILKTDIGKSLIVASAIYLAC